MATTETAPLHTPPATPSPPRATRWPATIKALMFGTFPSPLLASWALTRGGDALMSATTVTVGVCGAILCWPLSQAANRPAATAVTA